MGARIIGLLLLMALGQPAGAQLAPSPNPQPILSDWSRVRPAFARSGMVASQEAQATRIGVEVLERGGTAVDAAVAVGFALAVTLPRAGNIGGGGFMLIHMAEKGETIALDYREMAPKAAHRDMFLDDKGNVDPEKSRESGLAVGIPGTVMGLVEAHQRYGSDRFTLLQLMTPAIRLARNGIIVDEDLADSLPKAAARLGRHDASRAIFFGADGAVLPRGARLVQADLAATLDTIARKGVRGFYEGPVGEKIVASVTAAGGRMSLEDLAAYRIVERKAVRGRYRGFDVVSMPPPSSGGVHIIQLLNILEGYDLAAMGAGSADALHVMAEAMKLAYADRSLYLGDPDFVTVPVTGLTAKGYAAKLREVIDMTRAKPAAEIRPGAPQPFESDQTTHFSVVDRFGNAVSNTYTLNFSYGVGLVAAGTGVLLNNEMDDFAAKAGVPNAFGLIGGDANAPQAGKRPLSSMSPTLVLKDGQVVLVTGSPGGSRIISTVLQQITGIIDHRQELGDAVTAPRMHHQWSPDELVVERGLSPDTLHLLRGRGHKIVERATSGSVQTIQRVPEGWLGFADQRQRGTLAAGHD